MMTAYRDEWVTKWSLIDGIEIEKDVRGVLRDAFIAVITSTQRVFDEQTLRLIFAPQEENMLGKIRMTYYPPRGRMSTIERNKRSTSLFFSSHPLPF